MLGPKTMNLEEELRVKFVEIRLRIEETLVILDFKTVSFAY